VEAGKRFCGDCGAAVASSGRATAPAAANPARERAKPVAERRLTTVLFGDLVGFTTLSESRDAEDVRELLSAYFDMAKTVVSRYGGTIEKFIGDAVMAVWGVPVAHEDDAERAVRAGLDLIAGMADVAATTGVPDLTMRVGILTGEVAVTIGAVGEGMVAGDAVNTAARIQSVAAPGEVWVDDTTRSLSAAAVSYADAGEHHLKGKAEPVWLHAAKAVVANVGGVQRVDGLEAPFVGRDHELRLVKELFHGSVEERRPRLVAVSGLAGVGKTRLAWEYEKYIDGITHVVKWHRGRVLSYGDGVSFWAVAEMVRARVGVVDGDPPALVDEKLSDLLESIEPDREERGWLQPRLAALLGRAATGFAREDLFAAWSTFFERVAGSDTVVLVFDDMQHADADLLDFLDHLLDTARYPLFVLTLARPELLDARPGWGSGRRATPVHLEPLGERAMGELVDGLVEGLPDAARDALVERSGGIPVYALEMVRALIDRDAVIPSGGRYVVAPDAEQRADLAALDAPPSLQALIAARLDALAADERRLVQEATAHGFAFSRDGIEATSTVNDLDAVLGELVRKEIFELHTDRFSAEHGQYRFVQALVRTVAYETLSRRDRKAQHVAVAGYLEQASDADEMAAIIARHYLDAVDSGPDDPDAPELGALALAQLERAAGRAEALGSTDEALRHYTTALERDPSPVDRARLLEGAARTARHTSRLDEAVVLAEQARSAYEAMDRPLDSGRVIAELGDLLLDQSHIQAARDLLLPAYERIADAPDADDTILALSEVLARSYFLQGDTRSAFPYADRAMELAEAREDWARVVTLLSRQAVGWSNSGRPTGAVALLRAAVELGRREHLVRPTIVPLLNLNALLKNRDLAGSRAAGRDAVEATLQTGSLDMLRVSALNLAITCWVSGDWDEAEALYEQHQEGIASFPLDEMFFRSIVALIRTARDQPIGFDLEVAPLDEVDETSGYLVALAEAQIAAAVGDARTAADRYSEVVESAIRVMGTEDDFTIVWPLGVEGVLAAGDVDEAARLVGHVAGAAPGRVSPLARVHLLRLRALVASERGDDPAEVDADLGRAADAFREFGVPFYLARTLLERGRLLAERGDDEAAAPLLEEAAAIFASLRATRWSDQVRELTSTR
jgi:class 3 adenylate cyclase/tetratricopeptide (TPR) repeat protein